MKKLLMIFTILSVFCAENVVSIEPAGKPEETGRPKTTGTPEQINPQGRPTTAQLQPKAVTINTDAQTYNQNATTLKNNLKNQKSGFSFVKTASKPADENSKPGNSLTEKANDLNVKSQEFNEGAKALKEQTAAQKSIFDIFSKPASQVTPEAKELASKLQGKNANDTTQGVIDSQGQPVDPATQDAIAKEVATELQSQKSTLEQIIQKILDCLKSLVGMETSGEKAASAARLDAENKAAAQKVQENIAAKKAATQNQTELDAYTAYKNSWNPLLKTVTEPVLTDQIIQGQKLNTQDSKNLAATQKMMQKDQYDLWN